MKRITILMTYSRSAVHSEDLFEGISISRAINPHQSIDSHAIERIDRIDGIKQRIESLDSSKQLAVIGEIFSNLADKNEVYVSRNYLQHSLTAMQHLGTCGRHNLLDGLARGLSTMRDDGKDSIFPAKRVVTGLIEYSVDFFTAGSNAQHVRDMYMYLNTYCYFLAF